MYISSYRYFIVKGQGKSYRFKWYDDALDWIMKHGIDNIVYTISTVTQKGKFK